MNIWMIAAAGSIALPQHGWFFDEALAKAKCDALNVSMPTNPYYEVIPVAPGSNETPGIWVLTWEDLDRDNYDRSTVREEKGWFPTETEAKETCDALNAARAEWDRVHNPHIRHGVRERWGYTSIDPGEES